MTISQEEMLGLMSFSYQRVDFKREREREKIDRLCLCENKIHAWPLGLEPLEQWQQMKHQLSILINARNGFGGWGNLGSVQFIINSCIAEIHAPLYIYPLSVYKISYSDSDIRMYC